MEGNKEKIYNEYIEQFVYFSELFNSNIEIEKITELPYPMYQKIVDIKLKILKEKQKNKNK